MMKNNARRASLFESIGDFVRFIMSWVLAVTLLVPFFIIKLADKLTMWRIRQHEKHTPTT